MSFEQERLVNEFMDFAKNVAAKLSANLPIDIEDAIQCGYEGLVQAAHRFDESKYDPALGSKENCFKSYAYWRITGAVYDHCRANTFVRRRGLEKGLLFSMVSLDAMFETPDGDETPLIQVNGVEDNPDLYLDFQSAMTHLTDRERKVVMGLAVGATGAELAREFHVSESRISQVATAARIKLQERMLVAA